MQLKTKLLAALTAAALSFTALSLPVSANSRRDVDGDGKITIQDAYRALKAYANESAGVASGLTSSQRDAADVNRDGNLAITDAYQILMYYAMESAGQSPNWNNLPTSGAQMKTWKDLYREFLESGAYEEFVGSSDELRFSLAYIDDNSTPELIISTGWYHAAGAMVVTCYQSNIRILSQTTEYGTYYEFGSWGNIGYVPRGNLFNSYYSGMGSIYSTLYSIQQGQAVKQVDLVEENADMGTGPWYVNGASVSQATYEATRAQYPYPEMIYLDYDNMHEIDSWNISYCLS